MYRLNCKLTVHLRSRLVIECNESIDQMNRVPKKENLPV